MIPLRTAREIPIGSLQPAEQPMTIPFEDAVATKLHARVVEFIAKPDKTDALRALLCKAVTPRLRDRTGFIRSIILTTLEEQRRVLVITLWSTEQCTEHDPWEEMPLVRELLLPLIDAWSRTRSYKVDLSEATDARSKAISLPIC